MTLARTKPGEGFFMLVGRKQFRPYAAALSRAFPAAHWPQCQNHRELGDHINRCTVPAALESADIGTIDLSLMGQRLLRQTFVVARLAQIAGEGLSYVHAREATVLSCISPRSMLNNRLGGDNPGSFLKLSDEEIVYPLKTKIHRIIAQKS
jgi:hypothetical protein